MTLGDWRRRRRVDRMLRQMERLDTRRPRSRRSGSGTARNLGGLAVFAAAVVGLAYVLGWIPGRDGTPSAAPGMRSPAVRSAEPTPSAARPDVLHQRSVRSLLAPTPGDGERTARLLPQPVAPQGGGGYSFLSATGNPTRWDPCRPIHYVIRDVPGTPAGGDDAIRAAVAEASKASGIAFVYDGTSDETPSQKRQPFQSYRYGDRWAPVLIAWTDPAEMPALAGKTFGVAQPYSYRAAAGSEPAFVTGVVGLDTPSLTSLDQQAYGFTYQAVVQHELGHLLGLDHVQDPTQLMYPTSDGVYAYAAGDLRGLAQLGGGSCHPEL